MARPPVTRARARARIAARLRHLTGADRQDARLDALQRSIDALEQRVVVGVHDAIDRVEQRVIDGVQQAADGDLALAQRIERGEDRAVLEYSRLETLELISATTASIASLGPSDTLVSVIMPTRNRCAMLGEAIASVRAQTHERWELLVVDDQSDDGTPVLLEELAAAEPRIRLLRSPANVGPGAARNLALDEVRGQLVAYLDDDNLMSPHWLRAVAWAFDGHPDADVLYGARLVELPDVLAPEIVLSPWDRQHHELTCLIDQNVLAHRAGLPEARQREGILGEDWEMGLRLTRHADPLVVPVVAAVYRTRHEERISKQEDIRAHWANVQRQALRMRPLRVAGTPGAAAALAGLRAQGAATAVWPASGGRIAEPHEHTPRADAVLVGPEITADGIAAFERRRLPFATVGHAPAVSPYGFCIGTAPAAAVADPAGDALYAWLLAALDAWRARHVGFTTPLPGAAAAGASS